MDRMDIEDDLESKIQAFSIPVGSFAKLDKKSSRRLKDTEARVCKEDVDSQKKKTDKETLKGKNVQHRNPKKEQKSKLRTSERSTDPKKIDKKAKSSSIPEEKIIATRRSVRISIRNKTSMRGKLKREPRKRVESDKKRTGNKPIKKPGTDVEEEETERNVSKYKDENNLSSSRKRASGTRKGEETRAKQRRTVSRKSKEVEESSNVNTRQVKVNKQKEGEEQRRKNVDKQLLRNQELNISPIESSPMVKPDLTKDLCKSEIASKSRKSGPSAVQNVSEKTQLKKTDSSPRVSVMKSSSSAAGGVKKRVSLREDFEVINSDYKLESSGDTEEHINSRHLKTSQLSVPKKSVRRMTIDKERPITVSKKSNEKEALAENLRNASALYREFYNKTHNVKLPNKMWSMHKDPRGAFVSFLNISEKSAAKLVVAKAVSFRLSTAPVVFIHGMRVNLRGPNDEISSFEMLRQLLHRIDGFVPCDGVESRSGSSRSEKCELYAEKSFPRQFVCKHCVHEQKFINLREDCEGVDFLR